MHQSPKEVDSVAAVAIVRANGKRLCQFCLAGLYELEREKNDPKRRELESLLVEVQNTQSQYWEALRVLERELGPKAELDDAEDWSLSTVDDLLEACGLNEKK